MFYPGRQPDSATDISALQTQSLNLYQANQELSRLNARLEQRLHDRTAELEAAVGDGDKFNPAAIPFHLQAVVDQTVALWKPHAEVRHLQLTHDIDSLTSVWLRGDLVRLNQVLANLISNALKFTQQGRINLSVDAIDLSSADNDGSVMLRIAVQDTGIGITPDLQRHLFNLFAQADGVTTNPVASGTRLDAELISGLGLPICKQLIVLMGGEISVDSVPGQGSCFTLAIPCQACQPHVDTGNPSRGQDADGSIGKHILVVDDNEINRSVAASMLERLGYTVSLAVNGEEAIAAVQRAQFDLVLMDYHMPLVDGVGATTAIRAWELATRRTAMPIIAVSASAFQDDRDRYEVAGMNDFVPKPLTLASIKAVVQKWLAYPPTSVASALISSDATLARLPEELFSRAQFSEMFTLAGARVRELLRRFGEDADRQLESMRAAALMQDAESVRRCAHKLKGSAATIGAHALASRCARVEQQARNQQLQHIMVDIEVIHTCYQRCRSILDTYLDQ